jgi:hypothetical protein
MKADEVATPPLSVISVSVALEFDVKVPLAPDIGAENVTDAPLTGFELLSTTVASRGAPNAVLTVASCRLPLVSVIDAGAPEVFVRLKLTLAVAAAKLAITVWAPTVPFAVNTDEVATPLALVVSVSVFVEFEAKVPLAPEAGAVKITNAPLTGAPPINTVATMGAAKAVLTAALCELPLVAAMVSVGVLNCELLQLDRKITNRTVNPRMQA